MMRIDLHAHTTVSDGTDSPAELVNLARQTGLDVVAITDHDTTAGWSEAVAALPRGLTLVRGAELSCYVVEGARRINVHLLAYLFDPQSPRLVEEQRRLRSERRARVRIMADRMAADGLPIDVDDVFGRLSSDAPAGRPHLAQALMRAGVVQSVDEAFDRFLGRTSPFYVPQRDTLAIDAIDMITDAGGVTVLAHPRARVRGAVVSTTTIVDLVERGLTGVEVNHPNHNSADRAELRRLANDLGIVWTGSSDYHGTNKTIELGAETTEPSQFEALVTKAFGVPIETG